MHATSFKSDHAISCLCLLLACAAWTGAALAVEPGEIQGLTFGADGETLSWDAEPLADHYNVYRGYLRDLATDFYGTPLDGEVANTTYLDAAAPPANNGFFYLVTAANADGEGTMGNDLSPGDAGTERANNFPWPGLGVAGRWAGPRSWPTVAIHSAVTHVGKVLTWQSGPGVTTTYLWDPVTDEFETTSVPSNIFCSGHSFLPDGRLLVEGGNTSYFFGPRTTFTFDPVTNSWSDEPLMRYGRYYPTSLSLGDGRVLVFSGNRQFFPNQNPDVEAYVENAPGDAYWQLLPGASKQMQLYPTMHLLPSGEVFHSGPEQDTDTLDPSTETWQYVGASNYGVRGSGTSVLLPTGHERVMILGGRRGGDEESTPTAEIIDLSAASPLWSYTQPMQFKRMHANTVILPNGKVLVSGGGYDDVVPTYPSEIFDPETDSWTMGPAMKSFRLYHSTGNLLPDGRVIWAGSNGNPTAEFYSPGYLFRGARPVISGAPDSAAYGATFTVDTPDAGRIQSVVLIRPGAVTHSLNMEQRYVPLGFVAGPGSLDVTAPSNPNVAPPGYYLLFILDDNGVPSEATFLRLL